METQRGGRVFSEEKEENVLGFLDQWGEAFDLNPPDPLSLRRGMAQTSNGCLKPQNGTLGSNTLGLYM